MSSSCEILIGNKWYNVGGYLHEHPGGEEIVRGLHRRDATLEFEEIGHSPDAYELLKTFYMRDLTEADGKLQQRRELRPLHQRQTTCCETILQLIQNGIYASASFIWTKSRAKSQ